MAAAGCADRFQMLRDPVGAVLGAGEHEGALHLAVACRISASTCRLRAASTKMTLCSTRSAVVATGVTATCTGSRSMAPASDAISFGMVAEKNSVCRCGRDGADDLADRHDEAEVEHVVGLVQHQDLDAAELHGAVLHVVEQPAGRGDQHVDAARHRLGLPALRHAAEHQRGADAGMAAIGAEAFGDLAGQLARRAQNQHAAARAASAGRLSAISRCRIGSAKAAVLPVPVWAMPCTSRPCKHMRDGLSWIGVGAA